MKPKRPPRMGITLIEMLVSLAIGMVLVALGTSALLHVTKLFSRNIAHMQGHDDAALIQQRLDSTLESLYHPAQMGCRADPGEDSSWGTGDEIIELTWMSSLRSLDDGTMSYAPQPMHDLIWQRMRWTGDGKGGGRIEFANSTGRRVVSSWTGQKIALGPFVRRDRRRDLDDNDLRYLPGMDVASYQSMDIEGDGDDLDRGLSPWHPSTTLVENCVIEWVDQDGYQVRCDPASGVTIRSPSGGVVPPLGTAYSSGTVQVLDGTWLDGRAYIPDDVSAGASIHHRRSTSSQRPVLIRIHFDLVLTVPGQPHDPQHAPRLSFAVSIAPALALPPL